ncbi:DUF6879 family protein [Streptomyces sp. NPDC087270]|uniref:DUF6879 family protein n=1 Tax=Streptomyces sp. NPDC087270 TaxID=3365774 RepID=UPI00381714CE
MLDLDAPPLPTERGERFDVPGYRADFRERRAAIRDGDSWKLERLQHFEEVDPSRDALRRGDWGEALRLFEADRDSVRTAAEQDASRNHRFHRLRVVEEPLTPYVQWELHWLQMRAEYGHRIRVVSSGDIVGAESAVPLPELTLLDDRTLYRVLYTEAGATEGAVRFTDAAIVTPWAAYLRSLYAAAEDMTSYFHRAVAPLPPPPAA